MIIYDLPMSRYLAGSEINSSRLKLALKTSLDFKESENDEHEDTANTALGTTIHTMLLEPDRFEAEYAIEQENLGDKRSGAAKKAWDEFKKVNTGKTIVPFDSGKILKKIQEKVSKNITLRIILASSSPEVTATCEVDDLIFKARADLLGKDTIYDIKTISGGISDDDIYRYIKRYRSDFQAVHHMAVFNANLDNRIENWVWIFIDTESPACHIRMIQCPKILLEQAILDREKAIEIVKECTATGVWSGYSNEIETLQLPEWATKRN
jgi:hypothetical protein